VGDVAQVLADVPAVPEGIVELAVAVAPEHVLQRLSDLGSGGDRLGEHGVGVGNLEGKDDGGSADRGRGEDAQLWELVGEVDSAVVEAQLDGHQASVRRGDSVDLFGAEGITVERGGALGALDHEVRSDGHASTVSTPAPGVLDVLAAYDRHVADERVRMWRPAGEDRVLLMAGRTARYAIEPRGEYVFGIVRGAPMRARRGRQTHLVRPGELVAWDPSDYHAGWAVDGRAWTSRLMVVEVADLWALAEDPETDPLTDVMFPQPVICDPDLATRFVRLHIALESASTRLERDERLSAWLQAVIERSSAVRRARSTLSGRDERALRVACEYLADCPERNVGLDELAAAAGIGKFRLVRLFRERTGLPPHALQVAHRIRAARRLLEAGQTIAAAAAATGFVDQSHLHRHFQRSLGVTPGEYQRRLSA
jgi:AraC-like DNA-binding protein